MLRSRQHFCSILAELGLQGKPFKINLLRFRRFCMQKWHAEIGVMTFERLLGGAGGRGEACLSLQVLQNGDKVHSRPAPPTGVQRILKATPSAASPFWFLGIAIWELCCFLFDILGTMLAPWGDLEWPFWRLGSTLEGHFGTTTLEDHGSSRMDASLQITRCLSILGWFRDLFCINLWSSKCS